MAQVCRFGGWPKENVEVVLFEISHPYVVILSYCDLLVSTSPPWLLLAYCDDQGSYWQCSSWFKQAEDLLEMIREKCGEEMYDKCRKLFSSPSIRMLLLTLDLQYGEQWVES